MRWFVVFYNFNRFNRIQSSRRLNLVMSGGGVKGIAYVGMYEAAEKKGYNWGNMAGVSAGALAGAFKAAGFTAYEMWNAVGSFDFEGIQMSNKVEKVPVVSGYLRYMSRTGRSGPDSVREFLSNRRDLLESIVTFSKEGCLFDGDYLEEWVSKELARKGVRTFGDLRGGMADKFNPRGYRMRMTGVDCNRAKIVVLPDDVEFYGMDPDKFEVAKAVRISTCVPFAFKPVELKKQEGNITKVYNLVDGGVFDRFPYWLIDSSKNLTVGFKLSGGEKPKFFSVDTALNVLKSIISAVQDIGIPKDVENNIKYIGEINTTQVHYLDFGLSQEDKEYLYNAGRQTAIHLFNKLESSRIGQRKGFIPLFASIFRQRWF